MCEPYGNARKDESARLLFNGSCCLYNPTTGSCQVYLGLALRALDLDRYCSGSSRSRGFFISDPI